MADGLHLIVMPSGVEGGMTGRVRVLDRGPQTPLGQRASGLFAVLKLDGRVQDGKTRAQFLSQFVQNPPALRGRNVGDDDVAGECVQIGPQAPDMQVMHIADPIDLLHRAAHLGQLHPFGRAFQEDVQGLADNVQGRPEDQRGNQQRQRRIDPQAARELDDGAAHNDRRSGKRISQHVQEGPAHVQVAADPGQHPRQHAVDCDANGGHRHHGPRPYGDRMQQAAHGRNGDPHGDDNQRQRVDKGRQHLGPVVAISLCFAGRPRLQMDGQERKQQRQKVRGVVSRLGEQRQTVHAQTGDQRQQHIRKRERQRQPQHALHPARSGHVEMHAFSLLAADSADNRRLWQIRAVKIAFPAAARCAPDHPAEASVNGREMQRSAMGAALTRFCLGYALDIRVNVTTLPRHSCLDNITV